MEQKKILYKNSHSLNSTSETGHRSMATFRGVRIEKFSRRRIACLFSEERREKCLEPHPLTISAVSRRLAHKMVPVRLDRESVIAAPPSKSALCQELAEPFYRTDFLPHISLCTAQTQMLTLTSLSAPAVDTAHHSSKRNLDLF